MTIGCVHKNSCTGAVPLFVGHNNPRFRYARSGYLSVDCPCPSYELPETEREQKVVFRPRPIDDELDQLKARVIHAEKKLETHITAKRTQRGQY